MIERTIAAELATARLCKAIKELDMLEEAGKITRVENEKIWELIADVLDQLGGFCAAEYRLNE